MSNTLKWLARGSREEATSFSGYIINNIRFNTKDCENSRQNSGVLIEAKTICRSSASDMRQVIGKMFYYGVIRDIILLDYHTFRVPIFKCDWANIVNGLKVDDHGFTLVNLPKDKINLQTIPSFWHHRLSKCFILGRVIHQIGMLY